VGEEAMSQTIQAYPLQWPPSWRRIAASQRTSARFSKSERQYSSDRTSSWNRAKAINIADGRQRVIEELQRMGIDDSDLVISSDVRLRMDGQMHAGAGEPADPGVAVYWRKGKVMRCMAIDRYDRVADNLAAIAATLDAMRAIERHGGAEILDRAFTGFTALPSPEQPWQTLGLDTSHPTKEQVDAAHRRLASQHHPDKGGSSDQMARINAARDHLYENFRA
jgi:hypothetical protein